MNKENPLVSIIVRTKDRPKLLQQALRSIASQTYRHIEVVLVNDGGCDLDIDNIKDILDDISLNYRKLSENTGRAHAGNVGIEYAHGAYIGFLDDDDELYPEHIETLVTFLVQSDYEVAYSDSLMVYKAYNSDTQELTHLENELAFSEDFNYDRLLFENYIHFMCLLFRRKVLITSGGFDNRFELYEDWELLIRIGATYPFHHIKKTTANYIQWSTELQISQNNKDPDFLKQSYMKIVSKHIDRITPNRIHNYVSRHAFARYHLKELKKTFEKYKIQLDEKDRAIIDCLDSIMRDKDAQIREREIQIKEKDFQLGERDAQLIVRDVQIGERDATIREKDALIEKKDHIIKHFENTLKEKDSYINIIHTGHSWKLLNKYFYIRDKVLPLNTKRRLFYNVLIEALVAPRPLFKSINKANVKKFFYYLKIADPLTIEKKIAQKLSFEVSEQKTSHSINGHNFTDQAVDNNYFTFLFNTKMKPGEEYVPLSYPNIPKTDMKLIAFYLPQFHPIQENDTWWSKGFTEWANVTRAIPQFIDHYQPRLPGELGFYDLRIPEVQKRQVELAKQYGIHGFCFHFFWFHGKSLLETPIKQFIEHCDFPFCINWANENWTRRWDGLDNDVLIAQEHSPEDDIAFIKHISPYLNHKNYIRVNSKPLLIIYRPALFPNPKATAKRWREWCLRNGIGDIYLALTHSFEHIDPRSIGFDAAIEFAPNTFPIKDITSEFTIINPNYKGIISDYTNAIEFAQKYSSPPYKKFRGICPSWDNEARRPGRGSVLVNSTPSNFKRWLKALCHFSHNHLEPDERFIFINAWNEWAEGAYLEPDKRYGYAHLQALADTLVEYDSEVKRNKILYVCHDAHFHGAQLLSLNIIKLLALKFKYKVYCILKSGGELEPELSKYATVYNVERDYKTLKEKETLCRQLYKTGIREALCNTVASGDFTKLLNDTGIKTVTLVHELPGIMKQMKIEDHARLLAEHSYKVVFPSHYVKEKFKTIASVDGNKAVTIPQGLYKHNRYKGKKDEARKKLREYLSLPEHALIILGVGFGDFRKGIDLFIEVANMVTKERTDVYFLWVGNIHQESKALVDQSTTINKNIIIHSSSRDVSLFYGGADLYLLTSREDPFPAVVLEAMDVALPVIGFQDSGGFSDIINEHTGALVPHSDVHAMAREIKRLLDDTTERMLLGEHASQLIGEKFNFTDYVYSLLALLGHVHKKVSVIIPNYNYEAYLPLRMHSILNQTYPIYEILFLDDASTDRSVQIVEHYVEEGLNIKLIVNEKNSGSAFTQWSKGLQMAQGDFIWIAEADDLSDNVFIEKLLSCFEKDRDVIMAYCQSKQIDGDGKTLSQNYFEYTNDIDKEKWKKDYIREGIKEISDTLAVKNTIPNVSSVLFKRTDISSIADKLVTFRVASDWLFYVWLLTKGNIAYVSQSLNLHRRHDKSIIKSEDRELHYNEVVTMQEYIAKHFTVAQEIREKTLLYREYLKKYFGLIDSGINVS
jgi:glycosyltransferase involved in cell wall biosynthesis